MRVFALRVSALMSQVENKFHSRPGAADCCTATSGNMVTYGLDRRPMNVKHRDQAALPLDNGLARCGFFRRLARY